MDLDLAAVVYSSQAVRGLMFRKAKKILFT